jgi:5-methyltetrahydropteroyltriglutamate--homocysteine methyltransferase
VSVDRSCVDRGTPPELCGALGERHEVDQELAFARGLPQDLTAGLPADRLAIHMCRGNWSPDETKALTR